MYTQSQPMVDQDESEEKKWIHVGKHHTLIQPEATFDKDHPKVCIYTIFVSDITRFPGETRHHSNDHSIFTKRRVQYVRHHHPR